MRPDISIVIPTFRRPDELGQAIRSVVAQAGVSTEIIVVDDCPDGSAEPVAARFRHAALTYHRMPVPSGGRPAKARNLGWRIARGGLVHFLDDDDRVPEGHYAAVDRVFAAAPGTGVVFGRVVPFTDGSNDIADETLYFARAARRARLGRWLGPVRGYAAALVFRETLLVCGAALIRRACLPVLGGFDETLPLCEDVDLYARAIRRFGGRFLDRPALDYRIGPSLMHRPDQGDAIRDSYRRMHARYRAERGALDFYALKSLSRLIRI